jgi:cell division protein FtsQ
MSRRRVIGATLASCLALAAGGTVLWELGTRPILSVRIAGDFRHVSRDRLEGLISPQLQRGFFGVDVAEVRTSALALPWIRQVSVSRVWPDALHVAVTERRPVARWGAGALLEADGPPFSPPGLERLDDLAGLPSLHGRDGDHARVLRRHGELEAILAPVWPEGIDRLELMAREGWQVDLVDGPTLVLSPEHTDSALGRFVRAFAQVFGDRMAEVESIDTRYANGFAVRFKVEARGNNGGNAS